MTCTTQTNPKARQSLPFCYCWVTPEIQINTHYWHWHIWAQNACTVWDGRYIFNQKKYSKLCKPCFNKSVIWQCSSENCFFWMFLNCWYCSCVFFFYYYPPTVESSLFLLFFVVFFILFWQPTVCWDMQPFCCATQKHYLAPQGDYYAAILTSVASLLQYKKQ